MLDELIRPETCVGFTRSPFFRLCSECNRNRASFAALAVRVRSEKGSFLPYLIGASLPQRRRRRRREIERDKATLASNTTWRKLW